MFAAKAGAKHIYAVSDFKGGKEKSLKAFLHWNPMHIECTSSHFMMCVIQPNDAEPKNSVVKMVIDGAMLKSYMYTRT